MVINFVFYDTICRLDVGDGKEINLEKCPRSTLQRQCIKYLGPVSYLVYMSMRNPTFGFTRKLNLISYIFSNVVLFVFLSSQNEREEYEVVVERGRLIYRQDGRLVDTDEKSKWIFVLSTTRSLYVGRKQKGAFQHSSFLSGGATTAAGRLVAHQGVLEVHYSLKTPFYIS